MVFYAQKFRCGIPSHFVLFLGLVFLLITSSASYVRASESPLCKDLSKFSCAPGIHDDGTGTAIRGADNVVSLKGANVSAIKYLNDEVKKLLESSDDDKVYFKKNLLSTLGLTNSPDCDPSGRNLSERCLQNMQMGLVAILKTDVGITKESKSESVASIADLDVLTEDSSYESLLKSTRKYLRSLLKSEDSLEKIKTTFLPEVKKRVIYNIEQYVKDPVVRQNMIDKVASISFAGDNCSHTSSHSENSLPDQVENNAEFINPNKIYVCSGKLLATNSEFALIYVLTHEVAHSIDPCGITRSASDFAFKYPDLAQSENLKEHLEAADNAYPIEGLISCLRGDNSLNARRDEIADRVPSHVPMECDYPNEQKINPYPMGGFGKYPTGGVYPTGGRGIGGGMNDGSFKAQADVHDKPVMVKTIPVVDGSGGSVEQKLSQRKCPPPQYKFAGYCRMKDQIGESVADWFATEVLADYISEKHAALSVDQKRIGYSNVWRSSCSLERSYDFGKTGRFLGVHPDNNLRINAMILVHPKIREQMGCATDHPTYTHCKPTYKNSKSPAAVGKGATR